MKKGVGRGAAAGGGTKDDGDADDGVGPDGGQTSSATSPTEPAMQVIVLGSGGGPVEDNVTGLLVRSTATQWSKGSVLAVDAGVHMAAIARIMEEHVPSFDAVDAISGGSGATTSSDKRGRRRVENGLPSASSSTSRSLRSQSRRLEQGRGSTPKEPDRDDQTRRKSSGASSSAAASYGTVLTGPFAGVRLPSTNARVNAGYVTRELVSTYLITHAHLDHIAGFVINTAALTQTTRPKRLAALSPTIDIFKTHIFNDLIWPNMSDEEGGIGLVTYMRLAEGGDVAIGEGDGRGYIEVCEGLGVKSWTISHGVRMNARRRFQMSQSARRTTSNSGSGSNASGNGSDHLSASSCVYDSTAYFIRDHATGKEVLVFGDVEPDVLSWNPRTAHVWSEAAPKVVAGTLSAIFIECSYDDSQSDETLFGHLAPRHLIRELRFLGERVKEIKRGRGIGTWQVNAGNQQSYPMKQSTSSPPKMEKERERESFKRKRKRGGGVEVIDDASNGLASASTPSFPSLEKPERRRERSSGSRPRRQSSRHQNQGRGQGDHGTNTPLTADVSPQTAWPINPSAEPRIRHNDEKDEDVMMLDSHTTAPSSSHNPPHSPAQDKPFPQPSSSLNVPRQSRSQEQGKEGKEGNAEDLPLKGVKVVIIHMKDTLRDDPVSSPSQGREYHSPSAPHQSSTSAPALSLPPPPPSTSPSASSAPASAPAPGSSSLPLSSRLNKEENEDSDDEEERSVESRVGRNILRQLRAYEKEADAGGGSGGSGSGGGGGNQRLGCEFVISRQGDSVWI